MNRDRPTLWIINGPNLNMLSQRETDLYGFLSLENIEKLCSRFAHSNGYDIIFKQSSNEGQLIEWVHEAHQSASGLLINAGAYSHTSIALMDALSILAIPIIDVHLTNIYKRESYRQTSYIAKVSTGTIAGFKENSYILGLRALIDLIEGD